MTTLLAFAALWILASITVAALLSLLGVPRHQDEELPQRTPIVAPGARGSSWRAS